MRNRHLASMIRPLALAMLISAFAPTSQAQTLTYRFDGVITNAQSVAAPWTGVVQGSFIIINIEVDATAQPIPLLPGQAAYDATNSISINIGGTTVNAGSAPGPDLTIGNDFMNVTDCEDFVTFRPGPAIGWDTELRVNLSASGPFGSCPELFSDVSMPYLVSPPDFDTTTFTLVNAAGGLTDLTGVLISGSVTVRGNDDCGNAAVLPSTFAETAYDATGATTDGVDATGFCNYGDFGDDQNHNDVWFSYTPDVGGCTYISTLGLAGEDTRLAIYEGHNCPDDPARIIACADDELQPTEFPFEAGLDVDLIAGTTYTVRLGMYGNGASSVPAGAGTLRIAQGPGADINSGGTNPGAPGCSPFASVCNGNGGDQMGCTDCPCMNNAAQGIIGGCLNSSGLGSRLIASGDPSVSLPMASPDDLRFEATNGPANQLFILNAGDALAPGNPCKPLFRTRFGRWRFCVRRVAVRDRQHAAQRRSRSGLSMAKSVSPIPVGVAVIIHPVASRSSLVTPREPRNSSRAFTATARP